MMATRAELAKIKKLEAKIKKQEQETQRINNLNNHDDMASRMYDRIHSKLIG